METGLLIGDLTTAMTQAGTILTQGFSFLKANSILLVPLGISLLSMAAGWVYSRIH